MRIRRPATLAATLMLAAVPIFSSGVAAGGGSSESARQAAEHNRIVSFWTRARMQAAVPRDFAYDSVRGFHIVPRAKPGSGGGNTGASWPNGKGLVYKATGKVYFQMNGSGWICSGTALQDTRANQSLVVTAGHCVYDEENGNGSLSGFATNWLFIPEFDSHPTYTCADTTYGCWTAQALVVNKGFATAGGFTTTATHYDWGFAVVGAGGKSGTASLEATVGTFNYAASSMTGGSSGGPWLSGFDTATGNSGTIKSLNSYGYSGQSNMYGPKFNADTSNTYGAANNTNTTSNTIVN